MSRTLILASGSPRRSLLLRRAGFHFTTQASDTPEDFHEHLTPGELVQYHARSKAEAVAGKNPEALVVGSDTLVVLDGVPLGKPANMDEAWGMIRRLAGREHHVCTGVWVACKALRYSRGFVDKTWVRFRPVNDHFIRSYFEKINPLDKAGAYAIQGAGCEIIEHIQGDGETVMGLPTKPLAKLLRPLLG